MRMPADASTLTFFSPTSYTDAHRDVMYHLEDVLAPVTETGGNTYSTLLYQGSAEVY